MIIRNGKSVLSQHLKLIPQLLIVFFFSTLEIYGQKPITFSGPSGNSSEKDTPTIRDRIFYGGSFALQLGTITNIEFSPVIGYWLLPRLAVAAGPSYRYYKYQYDHTTIYGGKSYLQFVFLKNIDKVIPIGAHTSLFLHLEDEFLSLDSEYWRNVSFKPNRFEINTILAGGGLSQQIGKRAAINFIIIWPLNQSKDQVYNNPEIRISFVF